ncbi:MAG TPA: hypothetical protein VNT54_17155 [Solirubrobacteraceae bacterium]|nr:hypothetical protein [Solirubrobacteraceae bacterium]
MPDDDRLDALSSKELHDLAVRYALRHLDIPFFYRLMRDLPVAEAAIGDVEEAQADALTLRAHIDDVTDAGEGEVAELLRPVYLNYLRGHGVAAHDAD